MLRETHLQTLTELCNLPTAPYCERHVIGYLLAWGREHRTHIRLRRDPAGNVYLQYRKGTIKDAAGKMMPPLIIEAHMDHPGFLMVGKDEQGRLLAEFRGGVKPSHFQGAEAAFWVDRLDAELTNPQAKIHPTRTPRGVWVTARVLEAKPTEKEPKNYIEATLEPPASGEEILPGMLGMWALPDAAVQNELFAARVCDDIAGLAAGLCLLEELIEQQIEGHVIVMASRAEEVGFAGVLAALQNRWTPKNARVIGVETSKASAGGASQGEGMIIRVGDRQGIFSPGLTHFIMQAAGAVGDEDAGFKYQRKLMDGGTCNSTAFTAFGYDAAGVCLPLGNYHNMTVEGEIGWGDGAKAGPGIASETIHLADFAGLVRTLVEVVKRYPGYKPHFGVMRERLEKLHETEQRERLYATSDQGEPKRPADTPS